MREILYHAFDRKSIFTRIFYNFRVFFPRAVCYTVRMKRLLCITFCLLILLAAPRAAAAEDAQAEDLTARCTFVSDGYGAAKERIFRSGFKSYQQFNAGATFSLSWDDGMPNARLCLQWRKLPEGVTATQYDADGAVLVSETLPAYPETVTPLSERARKVEITAGEDGMSVLYCRVYGEGTLPEPFHEWIETPQSLDYLLISTHPDDDVLFLGSIVPVYGAQQGYTGSIAYVTCSMRERMTEAENGAWEMGLRYRPLFMGFQDIAPDSPDERKAKFKYEELLLATVRVYRTYHPLVVVAQDLNGEYGHWQHKLTSRAAVEAASLAADPSFDVESVEQYGTWQVQKVLLHLYPDNPITVDAHAPLSFFGGDDAFTVAKRAYKKHETQQQYWFAVKRDDGQYAFNRFGMAYGVVEAGEDVFDNIDESLFSFYVPPTPEPTDEPTPTPTATPTPTPTSTPTPTVTCTPAPTAAPQPKVQSPRGILRYAIGILLAAGAVFAAAYCYSKKKSKRA